MWALRTLNQPMHTPFTTPLATATFYFFYIFSCCWSLSCRVRPSSRPAVRAYDSSSHKGRCHLTGCFSSAFHRLTGLVSMPPFYMSIWGNLLGHPLVAPLNNRRYLRYRSFSTERWQKTQVCWWHNSLAGSGFFRPERARKKGKKTEWTRFIENPCTVPAWSSSPWVPSKGATAYANFNWQVSRLLRPIRCASRLSSVAKAVLKPRFGLELTGWMEAAVHSPLDISCVFLTSTSCSSFYTSSFSILSIKLSTARWREMGRL